MAPKLGGRVRRRSDADTKTAVVRTLRRAPDGLSVRAISEAQRLGKATVDALLRRYPELFERTATGDRLGRWKLRPEAINAK